MRPTRPAVAVSVLALLSVALLVAVAAEWRPLLSFDTDVARTVHERAVDEPGLTHANRILTDWIWDPWTLRALCAVMVLWLLRTGARRLALWVAATAVAGALAQQALKAAIGRERPHWPDPLDSAHFAAFPSGHAMSAALIGGLALWVAWERGAAPGLRWTTLALVLLSVIGVGLTRLWLGVHWPTDVLGGWLFGALTVGAVILTYERAGTHRTQTTNA